MRYRGIVVVSIVLSLGSLTAQAQDRPHAGDASGSAAALRPESIRSGRVELLAKSGRDDYDRSCVSFERGLRGEPGREWLREDYDVSFTGDAFRVDLPSGDSSVMWDLGAIGFDAVTALPASVNGAKDKLPAVTGHLYLVHKQTGSSDRLSVFRVVALRPDERCTIEWLTVVSPSLLDSSVPAIQPADRSRLAALLEAKRAAEEKVLRDAETMTRPRVVLQVRAGANGGNPNRIDMRGHTSIYIAAKSRVPLSFDKPVQMGERSTAYFEGGLVPAGKVFVIERVKYSGTCAGDTNGSGEFTVRVGPKTVVEVKDAKEPQSGVWEGPVEIESGDESTVYLHVGNSSMGDVLIEGHFRDAKGSN